MDLQDAFTPADIGQRHHYAPVEAARAQQRWIEHIGAIGGGDQDDAFVRFEAVHFHQQLVERLLALIVPPAQSRAAVPAHGVNFVNEDDARRVLFALLEQVPDARGAHADEHFHEVGSGNGEEWDVRFSGDGARQKGLARSWRAH